ncbi:hypothetical protein GCM10009776_00520 [Microbacterium deminutum]|uniref:Uncharacterized protein n=1 Tax=Microbacterium deminutum TaxID=344164 RepID=A0ABN2Q3F4_9MICO
MAGTVPGTTHTRLGAILSPMGDIVSQLLASDEPSIRWRGRTAVLAEPHDAPAVRALQEQIRRSDRAKGIIDGCRGSRPSRSGGVRTGRCSPSPHSDFPRATSVSSRCAM